MADFEINKGVGREVEFKGLPGTIPVCFCHRTACRIRDVRHHVYGGRRTVNLHRFRGIGGYGTGMADLYAEP